MTQPPWKLVITTLGAQTDALEADVYADNWLAALRRGREQMGDPGGVPPGASCLVAESGEVTILDPANRRRYTLSRASEHGVAAPEGAAPETADASAAEAANAREAAPPERASEAGDAGANVNEASAEADVGGAPDAPSSERMSPRAQQALPYSPQRADALQREYENARTRSTVPLNTVDHESERGARANLRALPKLASTPDARSSMPPPPKLDLLRSDPSLHPLATSSNARLLPAFSRDVEPTPRSPITYRERAYLLAPADRSADLESLLQAELLKLRGELADHPRGQLIHLAAFDKPFRETPDEPPIATLEWSDWRGNAVFVSNAAAAPARAAEPSEAASEITAPGSHVAPIPRAPAGDASTQNVALAATELPPAPATGQPWGVLPDVLTASEGPREPAAIAPALPSTAPPQPSIAHAPEPPKTPARRADAPPAFSVATRPAREAREDTGEVDGRLASAFEALPDLYFLPTPVAGLEFAIQLISRLVPCEAISACLYDINTDEFRFVAVVGPGAGERRASAVPSQAGLFGAAKRSVQDALLVPNASEDPRYQPAVDGRGDLEIFDLAYVPLRRNSQLLGMVQLINSAGDRGFTSADVAVLHYVTNQLSEFVATRRSTAG